MVLFRCHLYAFIEAAALRSIVLRYAGTFNMPFYTNRGCGEEGHRLIGPWRPAKAALDQNYVEVYWPHAGELSAVNAIGTQMRDPINLGLARWRMAV